MSCSTVLTETHRKEGGGKPKTTCQEKSVWLYVGSMDFPTPSKQIISDPPASQRHRKREGLCVCELPHQHSCPMPAAPGWKGQIWGAAADGVSWHVLGLSEVTVMDSMGRSWLPHTHTGMPQPWRDTGKLELRLHCPCPK